MMPAQLMWHRISCTRHQQLKGLAKELLLKMTYCVAISVKAGIVFCSDSRTNAGVDQVSTYSKMYRFNINPQRQFVMMAAGNLATTQAVVAQMKRDMEDPAKPSLLTVTTMDEAAEYVGQVSLTQQAKYNQNGSGYEVSFIFGGQIAGKSHRIMMIYAQGNYITTSKDTPFLQIGESKYGKPILDRILTVNTPLETAALCALVSMDSTMRSNLTVGPPIEVLVYEADGFNLQRYYRLEEGSEYLRDLNRSWDDRLKEAFRSLPPIQWAAMWDQNNDRDDLSDLG